MKIISPLTQNDLADAWLIEREGHDFPWHENLLYSNQGERYLNLKITLDGVMAGFAITQMILDEATLFNIVIAPDKQGKGLGRELLAALMEKLIEKGVITLWLEVRASNKPAIHLYHTLGFNETSIRRDYYPAKQGREDAIVMALVL